MYRKQIQSRDKVRKEIGKAELSRKFSEMWLWTLNNILYSIRTRKLQVLQNLIWNDVDCKQHNH